MKFNNSNEIIKLYEMKIWFLLLKIFQCVTNPLILS